MPLTGKGEKILSNMEKNYGPEKGKEVFYASKNAGTISGVDSASERLADSVRAMCDACGVSDDRRVVGGIGHHVVSTAASKMMDSVNAMADACRVDDKGPLRTEIILLAKRLGYGVSFWGGSDPHRAEVHAEGGRGEQIVKGKLEYVRNFLEAIS